MAAEAQNPTIALARQARDELGEVQRPDRPAPDRLTEALGALSGRCRALEARNRELAGEVKQLRAERRDLRSRVAAATNPQPSRPARARTFLAGEDERRRLERDLRK
jgi:predicted RNase H-like nuclease (RuvC/YqgF family)